MAPKGVVSTGWPAVRDTCGRLGLGFDGWQDGGGRLILAKRADGLYAADTVVISIPRQVGKTYLVGAIVFALCIIIPNLTVVWTAHRFKTAREVFSTMQGLARRKAMRPYVERVLRGAGDEAIEFRNGSRILFGARERGFGRGFSKVDVLVLDEGQILTEAAMDDMTPATNVSANPLILIVGTPPKPTDPGEVFTMLRQEALDGESQDTLYIELSADRGCDPRDREQWRKANPSYPHRTSERAMLRMLKNLSEASFVREALGIWDEVSRHQAVIKASAWRDFSDVGPADGVKPDALGVDMSHGRELSVSACWLEDDNAHGEEVWAGVDEDAALAWIVERAGRRTPVVIDNASPAASLAPALRARKVRVITTSAPDMAKACGLFVGKFDAGRFTHANQESVNQALQGARKRAIGTAGGWGWDRRDDAVLLAPIVSMTLALFGATATKRSRSSEVRKAVTL
ncbi:terminase [Nocardia vulneris]|uniref:terminase n=1 Tax=Nocardia vulneris TaxID=1141657 RepID=UPI000ADF2AAD|nr:terminase [Nocardia vulneris]